MDVFTGSTTEPEVTATGKISGTVKQNGIEDCNRSGIILTLEKTDGLSTQTAIQTAALPSCVTPFDGSFLFENLEPGIYTVYALSPKSSPSLKAVCTNVVVRAAETTVAETLKLTATGSIKGKITLDNSLTGNTGFLVFVAGTSYMAMTDDAGNYTISGVPAGEGYLVVATKNGVIHNLSSNITVTANGSTSMINNNFTSAEIDNTIQGEKGDDGKSIVWLGSFASSAEINNPSDLNAFFNTTDGCSYIYIDNEWTLLAKSGANGSNGSNGQSIVWKGELSSAPANPETNWAYFNTTDGCSYIWNGTKWDKLSDKGETGTTGATGANGMSIIWKGECDSAPLNPEINWAYFNITDGSSYIWNGTKWDKLSEKGANGETGANGTNGKSLVWKGELLTAPLNPEVNWAYFNITDGCSYIWNSSKWDKLSEKGAAGETGANGFSIVWKGELLTAPANPKLNWAYYNTIDSCSYIYNGETWNLLAKGISDDRCLGAVVNGTTLIGWENPDGAITIPNGVTSIGISAFRNCTELTEITIPDSVTNIGDDAFYGCSGLTSVSIPDSVTNIGAAAFYDCRRLTSITIPDGVTTIGSFAFYNCSGLTSIIIPDGITTIEQSVFGECSGLTSITIPDGVTSIEKYAFEGCNGLTNIIISDSVTNIGYNAFEDCSGLTSVNYEGTIEQWLNISFTFDKSNPLFYAHHLYINGSEISDLVIPDCVTNIGNYAFYGCSGLTSITIPNGVTKIGDYAFYDCSGLTSVTIPESVTNIGDDAFYGCSGLTSVTIPNSVTSIGGSAFNGCTGLTSIIIPNGVTKIESYAFCRCSGLTSITISDSVTSIEFDAFKNCSGLTSITIPENVTSIGKEAFRGCTGLTSINIPGSVTSIGESAFRGCTGLTSINISDSVTKIGAYAFAGCTGLTSITIPGSITSIVNYVFEGCGELASVTIGNGVTSIGQDAFSGCSKLTNITIPGSVSLIKYGAFYNCNNLTSVNYEGTIEQWLNISFSNFNSNPVYYAHHLYINSSELTTLIIPDNITSIGYYTFSGCEGLTSVTIGDGVTSIGDFAFSSCSNLTTVNYRGSEEQWAAISISYDYYLTNATINYNYTGE